MGLLHDRGMLFLVLVVAAAQLLGPSSAATYVIGDNFGGWTVPSGGAADYVNWASRHVFRVGDVLVFNFVTGFHDVAVTTKAAFESCSSTNPTQLLTTGPTNITLISSGEHHYICTFGQHCALGQKLAINVSASAAPAPAPTPTPSPPSPTTPSPSPSIAPTPTPTPTPAPTPTPTPTPSPMPTPGNSPSLSPSPSSASSPPPSSGGGGAGSPPPGSTPSDAGVSSPPPAGSSAASSIATTGFSLAATCVAIFYGIVTM